MISPSNQDLTLLSLFNALLIETEKWSEKSRERRIPAFAGMMEATNRAASFPRKRATSTECAIPNISDATMLLRGVHDLFGVVTQKKLRYGASKKWRKFCQEISRHVEKITACLSDFASPLFSPSPRRAIFP